MVARWQKAWFVCHAPWNHVYGISFSLKRKKKKNDEEKKMIELEKKKKMMMMMKKIE